MLIVRATRKLLDLIGPPDLTTDDEDTTRLGPWYATKLPWRPRVALLVSSSTLIPVFTRLTPAAGWPARVAVELGKALTAHGAPPGFIEAEARHMGDHRLGTTDSRSLVGVMTDYVRLADVHRHHDSDPDLLDLSLRLSRTPFSPLYKRNVRPDHELTALWAHTSKPSVPDQ